VTRILGIETSCDETAAAVVRDGLLIESNTIASQHDLHAEFGGVVPEVASRAHLERIDAVICKSLATADVTLDAIDAVAVGNRPGLIGSLLVGTSAAKALAWSLGKPLLGVDHVESHLYAAFMESCLPSDAATTPEQRLCDLRSEGLVQHFPALGLVVSGGHTSLYALDGPTQITRLGKTRDDAVGEAFDKAAVILDLGYPGGPNVERAARDGNSSGHRLPRSLLDPASLDFSFSGLKTALLYRVRGHPQGRGSGAHYPHRVEDLDPAERCDLAAAFQEAAIDVVMEKLDRARRAMAAQGRPPQSILIGGGVSANRHLRGRCRAMEQPWQVKVCLPPMSLCVDNAAMIAGFAYEHHLTGHADDLDLCAFASSEAGKG